MINYAKRSLKQVLAGDCHAVTKYELKFREDAKDKILCDRSLRKDDVEKFKDAIRRKLVYEMAYNNFTLRESVGFIDDDGSSRTQPRYFLVPSIDFHVHYSENQVTEMYISGNPHFNVDITEAADIKVNFSYSVYWYDTEVDGDTSLPLNETLHEKDHRFKNDDDHKWMSALMIWANVTVLWVGLILIVTLPYLMKYLMRYDIFFNSMPSSKLSVDIYSAEIFTCTAGALIESGDIQNVHSTFVVTPAFVLNTHHCLVPSWGMEFSCLFRN